MPITKLIYTIAILFTLSLACAGAGDETEPPPPIPPDDSPTQPGQLETATVSKVIDGDTIELSDGRRVRYIGINTPERGQPYYQEATEANRHLIRGREIQLEFDVDTFDKYGRTLAYVWADDLSVNLEIVRRGFANAYTVPPNVRYEAEFQTAERAAREAGRGLWAGSDVALSITHIEANAPGDDRENPNGEWVEVANQSAGPVQMRGYTLKDEANHIYTFAKFALKPGASFRLHSGQGRDTNKALYWGLEGESVWNNGADTAFLRDAEGNLVDSYSY